MKQRDGNIELLRCVLMYVIVLGHMCGMGPYAHLKEVHGIFSLVYFATDGFVFISGWYGIRFSWGRVTNILEMGLFAAITLFICSRAVLGYWEFSYSLGWFGNSYLAIVLMSPLINAGIDRLKEDGRLLQAWAVLAIASLLSWLPTGDHLRIAASGWTGNSFSTLLFVYISGRCARYLNLSKYLTACRIMIILVLLLGLNILWALTASYSELGTLMAQLFVGTRGNNCPLTMAIGIAVFFAFKEMKIPIILQRIGCFGAPSVFSIYLLHIGCSEHVSRTMFNKLSFSQGGG